MAINFPSSPADGEEYTDPNSGTWVYDIGTNSWTLTAAGSVSAFNFRGGHDFRQATPPAAPIESGDMWIHNAPDGTVDAVYTGISGRQIANGQQVLWDGNSYVMVSGTLPGYPDVGDGEGGTLDSRYLKLGANAPAQTVATTNETNFRGNVVLGDANDIALDAAAGSASFAGGLANIYSNGTIRVGSNPGTSAQIGADLSDNGQIRARSSDAKALRIFPDTGTDESIALNTDGSAEFDGNITVGTFDDGLDDRTGASLDAAGNIAVQRTSLQGSASAFSVKLGIATTANINADGTAYFAGNITAPNVTFNLEPDNDDNYTTTTDADGNETQVYNGPTLDVKERLQNLIARVDAIEADEVSDDATSSALLTLVASLSARIDALEAAG